MVEYLSNNKISMGIDFGEQFTTARHRITGVLDSLHYEILGTKQANEDALTQHAWEYQHLSLMTLLLHEDLTGLQQHLNLSDSQFSTLGSIVEYCRDTGNPSLESKKFALGNTPIRMMSQILSIGDSKAQLTTFFDMRKNIFLGTEVFIKGPEESDIILLYPDHLDVPGKLIQPNLKEPVRATELAMRSLIGSSLKDNPDNGQLTVLFQGEGLQERVSLRGKEYKCTFRCVNPDALQSGVAIYALNYKNIEIFNS